VAVTAYSRLRMGWGAFDLTVMQGQTPMYATTQYVTGGTSAAAGSGVGVRRASLVLDRQLIEAGADPCLMHFDFLNMTAGNPDDTWIAADYVNCETAINTWWSAVAAYPHSNIKFTTVLWHRVGTGVSKPNPAERIMTVGAPVTSSGGAGAIPQAACSITFRTGVRKSWGRTYLPLGPNAVTAGRPTAVAVDAIANATNTLVTSLASQDFYLVVVSKPLASSLNVENVEVDNVPDVIRRRRWKKQTYRKILP
jgi:hypothetical protein